MYFCGSLFTVAHMYCRINCKGNSAHSQFALISLFVTERAQTERHEGGAFAFPFFSLILIFYQTFALVVLLLFYLSRPKPQLGVAKEASEKAQASEVGALFRNNRRRWSIVICRRNCETTNRTRANPRCECDVGGAGTGGLVGRTCPGNKDQIKRIRGSNSSTAVPSGCFHCSGSSVTVPCPSSASATVNRWTAERKGWLRCHKLLCCWKKASTIAVGAELRKMARRT